MANLQRIYGKPSYQDINTALLRLKDLMNIMKPVELMLKGIELVQLFLLANPDKDRALIEPNLINYALIKLTKICQGDQEVAKKPLYNRRNGPNPRPT